MTNSIVVSIDTLKDKLNEIQEDFYSKVKLSIYKDVDDTVLEFEAIGIEDEDNANYGCIQECEDELFE